MAEDNYFQSCISNLQSSIQSLSHSIEAVRECVEDFPRFKYISYYEKLYTIYPDFQLDAARSKHAKQFQDEPRILLQEISKKILEMEKLQQTIQDEIKLLQDNPPENLLIKKKNLEKNLEELQAMRNTAKNSLIPIYKDLVEKIEYRGTLLEKSQNSGPMDTKEALIEKTEVFSKEQHEKLSIEYNNKLAKKELLLNKLKELEKKKNALERQNFESKKSQTKITTQDLPGFISTVKEGIYKTQDFKGQLSSPVFVSLVESCSVEADRLKQLFKSALDFDKTKNDFNSYSYSSLFKSFSFPENISNCIGKVLERLFQTPNKEISFQELNKNFSQSEQMIQELLFSLQILNQVNIVEYEYEDSESQSTFCSDQLSTFEKNTLIKLNV